MKTTIKSGYRMARSVLLSDEEDRKISDVAARITKAKGRTLSKSGLMREVTLRFMKDYEREQLNGKEKKSAPKNQG